MRYLVIALLLSGCSGRAWQNWAQGQQELRATNAIRMHGTYCDRMGFARDTDPWRRCVMDQERAAKETVCEQRGNRFVCQ